MNFFCVLLLVALQASTSAAVKEPISGGVQQAPSMINADHLSKYIDMQVEKYVDKAIDSAELHMNKVKQETAVPQEEIPVTSGLVDEVEALRREVQTLERRPSFQTPVLEEVGKMSQKVANFAKEVSELAKRPSVGPPGKQGPRGAEGVEG